MALNPSIIMAGQVPNTANTLARSTQAARLANTNQRENALAQVYQQQGPGILAGEQSALNALAQQDPTQAVNIQQAQQTSQRQNQAFQLKLQEYARGLSKEQAAAEARAIEEGIVRGISAYQAGDLAGVNAILQEAGDQPIQSLDQFPAALAPYGKALETFQKVMEASQGPQPQSPEGKLQADIDAGLVDPAAGQDSPDVEGESKLRKEFVGLAPVKDFQKQAGAFDRIIQSTQDPSAAGDLALIFNYMKLLDPGSVVREGEFATAQNAAGVPTRIISFYNNILNGERMVPEQRQDFLDRARRLYEGAEAQHMELANDYLDTAQQYGFKPERAVPDFRYQSSELTRPQARPGLQEQTPSAPPPEGGSQDLSQVPAGFSELPEVSRLLSGDSGVTAGDIWENLSEGARQRIIEERLNGG